MIPYHICLPAPVLMRIGGSGSGRERSPPRAARRRRLRAASTPRRPQDRPSPAFHRGRSPTQQSRTPKTQMRSSSSCAFRSPWMLPLPPPPLLWPSSCKSSFPSPFLLPAASTKTSSEVRRLARELSSCLLCAPDRGPRSRPDLKRTEKPKSGQTRSKKSLGSEKRSE